MTTAQSIVKVFIDNPEKWLNSKKVRSMAIKNIGSNIPISDFNRAFLLVRDNFIYPGKKMIKFKMGTLGSWYYSLTDKKGLIANHNYQLEKDRQRKERRKKKNL